MTPQTLFIFYNRLNLMRFIILAAQSHVKVSFEMPEYTGNVDGLGTLRILEAVRILGMEKTCKIYQASTSELYGLVQEVPQYRQACTLRQAFHLR